MTTCCLCTHPFGYFPQPSMLILYCFSQLLSVLVCPAHLSLFIQAHSHLAAHVFF